MWGKANTSPGPSRGVLAWDRSAAQQVWYLRHLDGQRSSGGGMQHRYAVSRAERLANLAARLLVGAGIGPKRMVLVTVVGRSTGKPYTTPLTLVETDGQRWLVAAYSGVAWAKNARASGRVKLSRGRTTEQVCVEPANSHEGAPVLKAYMHIEPSTRRAFEVEPDATLEEFEAIAANHPVFRVRPIGSGIPG
jgi:deazaflavin-dependent oxidoreductase (nitroreductase family)